MGQLILSIVAHFSKAGKNLNGWVFLDPAGPYGTEYLALLLLSGQSLRGHSQRSAR
jgi:hypothetical protein